MKFRPFLLLPFLLFFSCERLDEILFLSPGGNNSKADSWQEGVLIDEDEYEPDGRYASPFLAPLISGTSYNRSFHTGADEDWVYFNETLNAIRWVSTHPFGEGPLDLVKIEVYHNAELVPFIEGYSDLSFSTINGDTYYVRFKPPTGEIGCYQYFLY